MAPNVREPFEDLSPNDSLNVTAAPNDDSVPVSLSDIEIWTSSSSDEAEIELEEIVCPPNDLRQLLVKVASTEDLQTVTQLKLNVITREVSLQQLAIYTPALRELTLDGSVVSSLRDLGSNLRNLKILRLNRCNLFRIDSVSSLENLEEIHATDNAIEEISTCAFLSKIRIIDVRRNKIASLRGIFFLSLCTELQRLHLEGNAVRDKENFRENVKEMLPRLKYLDGEPLNGQRNEDDGQIGVECNFVVQFPPRVLLGNETNN